MKYEEDEIRSMYASYCDPARYAFDCGSLWPFEFVLQMLGITTERTDERGFRKALDASVIPLYTSVQANRKTGWWKRDGNDLVMLDYFCGKKMAYFVGPGDMEFAVKDVASRE